MEKKKQKRYSFLIKLLFIMVMTNLLLHAEENLALGCKCELYPTPNYALCKSDKDPYKLTDGEISPKHDVSIWVQPQTVGWHAVHGIICISLDFGKETSFDQVRLFTAGGIADVQWPCLMDVEVSDDAKNYHVLGSLTELNKNPLPKPNTGYHRMIYEADFMPVAARYVRLRIVPTGLYFFSDEIEFKRVTDKEPVQAASLPLACSNKEFSDKIDLVDINGKIRKRLKMDLALVTSSFTELKPLPNELTQEAKQLEQGIQDFEIKEIPPSFRSVVPMVPLQSAILRLHGKVLRQLGYPKTLVWTQDRFSALSPYALPSTRQSIQSLQAYMMNGERRGAVIQFTNASAEDISVFLSAPGLPAALFHVEFMDSNTLNTDAVALLPLQGAVAVPSGMTRQFYLRLEPRNLEPGLHSFPLRFSWQGGQSQEIVLELKIACQAFPKTATLSTGWWDYLDFGISRKRSREITRDQLPQALALEQEAGVDTTFCEHGIGNVNRPEKIAITEDGDLKEKLDFTAFDAWIAQWPDARNYVVYMSLTPKTKFGDAEPGTERFNRAVVQWARQWEEHLLANGPSPERVIFQMLDEPRDEMTWKRSLQWATAVRAGSKRLVLFTNPLNYPEDAYEKLKDFNVICPLSLLPLKGDARQQSLYERHLANGGKLWLYICHAGPFSVSPWYYRRQAWLAFKVGATGSFFWALGDADGLLDSWNQYRVRFTHYSPFVISPEGLTITKHFEAVAESIEDYEYLVMLKRLVMQKHDTEWEKIIQEAVDAMVADWKLPNACEKAEKLRLKLLEGIEALSR